ncbi:hypothetical protein SeLEV6574_g01443 [Synchytrium endobioticum]|uniref:CYTH domain-containing protein n=1 Tax=Synchytrium endobioticum TaxID=286115 RepID=A0A507DCQ1_9FUNG|nr:hypothetical protein SeLEV6574_g01443 [Synchytrium endobioticum]
MEVEVKLRLDADNFQRALQLLEHAGDCRGTDLQDNFFFDGLDDELAKSQTVFRIRRIRGIRHNNPNQPLPYTVTLKANAILTDGVSCVEELEHSIDASLAEALIENPNLLMSSHSSHPILNHVYQRASATGFKRIGHFKNTRTRVWWDGLLLEMDETHFDFATAYEIEIEHLDTLAAKSKIAAFLTQHGIAFCNSKNNKFAVLKQFARAFSIPSSVIPKVAPNGLISESVIKGRVIFTHLQLSLPLVSTGRSGPLPLEYTSRLHIQTPTSHTRRTYAATKAREPYAPHSIHLAPLNNINEMTKKLG